MRAPFDVVPDRWLPRDVIGMGYPGRMRYFRLKEGGGVREVSVAEVETERIMNQARAFDGFDRQKFMDAQLPGLTVITKKR